MPVGNRHPNGAHVLTGLMLVAFAAGPVRGQTLAERVASMRKDLAAARSGREKLLDALETEREAAEAKEPGRRYTFTLAGGLLRRPVIVTLKRLGGRWADCTAAAPKYNKSANRVNASSLKRGPDGLTGRLTVTLISDGWVPPPGRTRQLIYDVDIAVAEDKLTGAFSAPANPELSRKEPIGPGRAGRPSPWRSGPIRC